MAKLTELTRWRKNLRLSQGELAEKVGRSQRLISNWETGITPISHDALLDLRALGYEGPAAAEEPAPVTRDDFEAFMKAHVALLMAEIHATREELAKLRKDLFKRGA